MGQHNTPNTRSTSRNSPAAPIKPICQTVRFKAIAWPKTPRMLQLGFTTLDAELTASSPTTTDRPSAAESSESEYSTPQSTPPGLAPPEPPTTGLPAPLSNGNGQVTEEPPAEEIKVAEDEEERLKRLMSGVLSQIRPPQYHEGQPHKWTLPARPPTPEGYVPRVHAPEYSYEYNDFLDEADKYMPGI
ncbi:hypothetical protein NUW58_g6577 [Xylaria curta]|uniref:Uncharacterized protein n=1 Tax=Xylaria curta TaxID=42375 RepID=A0ACC1NTQ5_9PEZI|nr:hypothetical protein NUW58_g6577 [Xylaria curta]